MRYVDEYRDPKVVRTLIDRIRGVTTHPWVIMEVCGGQTHAIVRYGLDRLLPVEIELVHGPGCPVCVTPLETIDRALTIAAMPDVTFTSFGDMLRVPGSREVLLALRARGADIRIVYSPLDAVRVARANPSRKVVFFGIGLRIRHELRAHDAEAIFDVGDVETRERSECMSGLVLRGLKKPCDCPAFGTTCTPETPLGATMVSGEGACAAYFKHGRHMALGVLQ